MVPHLGGSLNFYNLTACCSKKEIIHNLLIKLLYTYSYQYFAQLLAFMRIIQSHTIVYCEHIFSFLWVQVAEELHFKFFMEVLQALILVLALIFKVHSYMLDKLKTIDLNAAIDKYRANKINAHMVSLQVLVLFPNRCDIDNLIMTFLFLQDQNVLEFKYYKYVIKQIDIYPNIQQRSYSMHSIRKIVLLIVMCMFVQTYCDDQGDWVNPNILPIESLVHPFYAGYLNVEYNKQYFYVYHPSESNPSKDPLMVRISAGPGCSSLYSWLYSKGPFIFTPQTDTFRINPSNWNKQANVLFIQGPVGVGFARHIEPSNQTQNMDDHTFAWQNIKALFAFYDKFPQLKDQQLYLSGQQYSGVTIPLMAQMIIEHNNDPYNPSWTKFNLKGFIVENPCTLHDQCDSHFQYTPYTIEYLYHHLYLSPEQYQDYRSKCTLNRTSDQCQKQIVQIQANFINTNSDINNIYKQCIKHVGPQKYKCIDMVGILNFLNHQTYKQDIHADTSMNWDFCNFQVMEKFRRNAEGSYPIYQKLLKEQRNLRIWVVSGSLSASVPAKGTRKWIEQLKYDLGLPTKRFWESWQYDDNINAGEVQQFSGITYASVRSAGSSIYLDQPEIGYHLIDSFMKGKSL